MTRTTRFFAFLSGWASLVLCCGLITGTAGTLIALFTAAPRYMADQMLAGDARTWEVTIAHWTSIGICLAVAVALCRIAFLLLCGVGRAHGAFKRWLARHPTVRPEALIRPLLPFSEHRDPLDPPPSHTGKMVLRVKPYDEDAYPKLT